MARIFLSHSSSDNALAVALGDWLTTNGWDDLFLDLDPERGILVGQRWERALNEAANRCEAVLFLVSRSWLASEWCSREFDLATRLNKRLFGVLIDADLDMSEIPARFTETWQFTDLASGTDHELFRAVVPPRDEDVHVTLSKKGLARLKAGLNAAGLDPKHFAWPPAHDLDRAPYRGLPPLEAEDAGILFGREAPIVAALDKLRALSEKAPPRLFVVLGASGAGKSSFLRAGLLPRLKRDDTHFCTLPVIRPSGAALDGETGLLEALVVGLQKVGVSVSRSELREALSDPDALIGRLADFAKRSRVPSEAREATSRLPTLIIPIDQAEELFQSEGQDQSDAFLKLLRAMSLNREVRVVVVLTIRTDRYERLQTTTALKEEGAEYDSLQQETFSLPPIPRGSYQTIIEGPARRLSEGGRSLNIAPELTAALLSDIEVAGGRDALPLLAFVLQRLWQDHGGKGELRLEDYIVSGRLAGAIEAGVQEAFRAADKDPAVPQDRSAREALLRRGLIPWLSGIDLATNEPRRNVARLNDIPEQARPLIGHLVDARLLSVHLGEEQEGTGDISEETSSNTETAQDSSDRYSSALSGEALVEPAHEALLRQWGLLRRWLEEDLGQLATLEGVLGATRDWLANDRNDGWLAHTRGRLDEAEALFQRPDLAERLGKEERDYLSRCLAVETERRDKELADAKALAEEQQKRAEAETERLVEAERGRKRARRGLLAASIAAILALTAASGATWFWNQAQEQTRVAEEQTVIAEQQARVAQEQTELAIAREQEAIAAQNAERKQREIAKNQAEIALIKETEAIVARKAEEEERIRAEMQRDEALEAQSNFLALASTQELGNGDVSNAIALARAALPKQLANPERPIVRNALVALRHALSENRRELAVSRKSMPEFNAIIVSPNEKTFVSLDSSYMKAYLWNTKRLTVIKEINAVKRPIQEIFYSGDGARILIVYEDGHVAIWDSASAKLDTVFRVHTKAVIKSFITLKGDKVITVGADSNLHVFETKTGNELAKINYGLDESKLAATYNKERQLVTVWSDSGRFTLVDVRNGVRKGTYQSSLNFGDYYKHAVTFDKLGKYLTIHGETANNTRRLLVFKVTEKNKIALVQSIEESYFIDHHFAQQSQYLLTYDSVVKDAKLRLWHLDSGENTIQFVGHEDRTVGAKFNATGDRLATWSDDKTIRLWNTLDGEEIAVLEGHKLVGTGSVFGGQRTGTIGIKFTVDGRTMLSWGLDGVARIWSGRDGTQKAALYGHEGAITEAHFSSNEHFIVTLGGSQIIRDLFYASNGTLDKTARLWRVEDGELIATISGNEGDVLHGLLLPNTERVLIFDRGGAARLWNVSPKETSKILYASPDTTIKDVKFWNSGQTVVAATTRSEVLGQSDGSSNYFGYNSGIELWSSTIINGWERLANVSVNFNDMQIADTYCVLITYDEKTTLLTTVGLENAPFRKTTFDLGILIDGHAFSEDGDSLIGWSNREHLVYVWDTKTGEQISKISTKGISTSGAVLSHDKNKLATFSAENEYYVAPDGEIVSSDSSQQIHIWDVHSSSIFGVLRGHKDNVSGVVFSADDTKVISWNGGYGKSHSIRVWDLLSAKEITVIDDLLSEKFEIDDVLVENNKETILAGSASDWYVFDFSGGIIAREIKHYGYNKVPLYNSDGSMLLTHDLGGELNVYRTDNYSLHETIDTKQIDLVGATYSSDSQQLLTWGRDNKIKSWLISEPGQSLEHNIFIKFADQLLENLEPLTLEERCKFFLESQSTCN